MKIQDLNQQEQQYLIKCLKIPALTPDAERKLLLNIKRNDMSAKKELVDANLKLVWAVIEGIEVNVDYSFELLWGAGNNGLFKAISQYSFDLKIPFRRYAIIIIKDSIAKKLISLTSSSNT